MFRKLISAAALAALMAGTASADNLREALVSAYQTNPTLTAQRETLKATDATVAIAKAAGPAAGQRDGRASTATSPAAASSDSGGKGPTLSAGADFSLPFIQRRQRQELGPRR